MASVLEPFCNLTPVILFSGFLPSCPLPPMSYNISRVFTNQGKPSKAELQGLSVKPKEVFEIQSPEVLCSSMEQLERCTERPPVGRWLRHNSSGAHTEALPLPACRGLVTLHTAVRETIEHWTRSLDHWHPVAAQLMALILYWFQTPQPERRRHTVQCAKLGPQVLIRLQGSPHCGVRK